MANFSTSLYTAQTGTLGQSLNVSLPQYRDAGGKPRLTIASYTCTGSEVTGDTVNLTIAQLNSKVIPSKCSIVATSSVGTGVTVRVGDSSAANRYAGTIDISAGGSFNFTATAGTDMVTPTPITTEATRTILLTFVAISAITAGKVITVIVEHLTPN